MAATLALIAALFFALAATLEQKGTLDLPTISLAQPMSIVRLAGNRTWLIGTLVLLGGYLFQAGALDRGRLSVIQPLLVSSVVFVLPLGYFLTSQRVGRREVSGAVAIVLGLGLFVIFGDPAGGNANASDAQWAVTIVLIVALCAGLLVFGSRGLSRKAAVYGTVAGVLFGLSSSLAMPTLDYLHEGVDTMLSHSAALRPCRDRPHRVRHPAGVPRRGSTGGRGGHRLGGEPGRRRADRVVLLDEHLSRPAWHVGVALIGLGLTFVGALVICLAREAADPDPAWS